MITADAHWPEPEPAARRVSDALTAVIADRIAANGGWIPFADYMQAALYEPGLGYYAAGSKKIGSGGDFVTAPELGDFLARGILHTAAPVFRQAGAVEILELGAGTGALAEQMCQLLEQAGQPRYRYRILEVSPELRARQAERLTRFAGRVEWLDRLVPATVTGLIVANEVADALPVSRFRRQHGGAFDLGVTIGADGFEWAPRPACAQTLAALAAIEADIGPLPAGYTGEFCPQLAPWLGTLADSLISGLLLLIDYGLPRRELYHPQRAAGSLLCHYRQRAHDNPFRWPGLQDITAWVDFTSCARALQAHGLEPAGFTTQGAWLAECLAAEAGSLTADPRALAALKTLLLPGEMGERFKVLGAARGSVGAALCGRDLSNRL